MTDCAVLLDWGQIRSNVHYKNIGTPQFISLLKNCLNVLTTNNRWYSDAALNSDGSKHVFSSSYTGDGAIPTGAHIGFEDWRTKKAPISTATT